MRKLLNTLYVTNPDIYLSRENEAVVAKLDGEVVMRVPALNLEGIVCFNRMGASTYLMQLCAEQNIGLCFLSPHGRFMARITGPVNGNVLLRRTQYRIADDEGKSLDLMQYIIAGKIFNSRKIIERFKRDYGATKDTVHIEDVSRQLDRYRRLCLTAASMDILRGIEGEAGALYFSVFDEMIIAQKHEFVFHGRNRRPPKDRVNSLLSFFYTLLGHEVQSALETVGLDPYVGFMHIDRPGRAGLALDLMEELRAYLADRMVLTMINRGQVAPDDFIDNGIENIVMTDGGKRKVLSAWQQKKKEMITHPFLNEKMPIGLIPYVQAKLLAKYLRGDLEHYPVFLIQ